jgi:hypothetical protein
MKYNLLIFLFVVFSSNGMAQDKPSLTKRETIDYLNKKVEECEGHFRTPDGFNKIMYYKNLSFYLDGEKVSLTQESSNYNEWKSSADYFERWNKQSFNPGQILSITEATSKAEEPLGIILITLKSNSVVSKQYISWYKSQDEYGRGKFFGAHDGTESTSTDQIGFVYLSSDDSNFSKIKKALEHLRDLYNAEDDPFGE